MKKLLLLLSLLPLAAIAQTTIKPDCSIPFNFTTTATTSNLTCGNNTLGITNWVLVYSSTGFSGISLVVQSAPDVSGAPGSWGTFGGTVLTTSQYPGSSGVNPNTATTSANTGLAGYFPWIRVNLTSITGTGKVTGSLYGFLNSTLAKANGGGSSTCSGDINSACSEVVSLGNVTNGTLQNSGLVNTTITINSVVCTLGGSCTIATTITGGSCSGIQFVNAISTSGVPTCGTPTGSGSAGGGVLGYSATALTIPTAGTTFLAPVGGALASTTEANVTANAPAAAAISNMYVTLSAAPGTGNTIAFTFRDAGSSTAVTCTISGASATSCQDITHSFTPVVGDALAVQVVTTGTVVIAPAIKIITEYGVTPGGPSISWFGGTVTPIVTANWTGLGSGCANSTVVGFSGGNALQVFSSAGSQNTCGWQTALSAGNFSHVFVVYAAISAPNFGTVAVGFTDGTKIEYCGLGSGSNSSLSALAGTQAKATALSGGSLSAANGPSNFLLPFPNGSGPMFFRLSRTGTNLACDYSPDGVNFTVNLFNDTAPFLTASALYFGADPRGSTSISAGLLESYQD